MAFIGVIIRSPFITSSRGPTLYPPKSLRWFTWNDVFFSKKKKRTLRLPRGAFFQVNHVKLRGDFFFWKTKKKWDQTSSLFFRKMASMTRWNSSDSPTGGSNRIDVKIIQLTICSTISTIHQQRCNKSQIFNLTSSPLHSQATVAIAVVLAVAVAVDAAAAESAEVVLENLRGNAGCKLTCWPSGWHLNKLRSRFNANWSVDKHEYWTLWEKKIEKGYVSRYYNHILYITYSMNMMREAKNNCKWFCRNAKTNSQF